MPRRTEAKGEPTPDKYVSPVIVWEKIRNRVFEEVAHATGSRFIAERELFVLVKPRFRDACPDVNIPPSAFCGVTNGIYTRDSDLRWTSVEGYHAYCATLQAEGNGQPAQQKRSASSGMFGETLERAGLSQWYELSQRIIDQRCAAAGIKATDHAKCMEIAKEIGKRLAFAVAENEDFDAVAKEIKPDE